MSTPVFNPPQSPSAGMTDKPELKILRADFGDGYSQPTPAGLNHMRRVLKLQFEYLEAAEKGEIVAFLEARQGTEAFHYALPGEMTPTLYTCDEWEVTALGASMSNVAATFRQFFTASS